PTQIMAAMGGYHGEKAVALGASHYTSESTLLHAGVAIDSKDTMYNVGVTKKFGTSKSKKHVPDQYKKGPISSITVMQQEIGALQSDNRALKAANERMAKENELLRQAHQDTQAQLATILQKLGI
ncbi:MAG: cell division protein ZapB, partial [Veillonella sp.]|nr:cell division protein ZapB [Veillonella sp.]